MTKKSVYYETMFVRNGKQYPHRTKSLTPLHEHLRRLYGGATLRCDPNVPWPFGVYAEVIAESPKPAPKKK